MKVKKILGLAAILLLGAAALAQEFPRTEVGVNYTYARYAPSASYSKGHSLNGGGGSVTINWNEFLGIKVDLQGYGSNETSFNIPPNNIFTGGLSGKVQGNLFTYQFGPQFKVRAHICCSAEPTRVFMATHSRHCASLYQVRALFRKHPPPMRFL
jgi:hypothetical protein